MTDLSAQAYLDIVHGPVPQTVDAPRFSNSLRSICDQVAYVPFLPKEVTALEDAVIGNYLDSNRIRVGYDLRAPIGKPTQRASLVPEGVVCISSRQWGYDFALLKVRCGRSLFGNDKYAVRIFRSVFEADAYMFMRDARSAWKAFALLDDAFQKDATAHFC